MDGVLAKEIANSINAFSLMYYEFTIEATIGIT